MTVVSTAHERRVTRVLRIIAVLAVIAMIAALTGLGLLWMRVHDASRTAGHAQASAQTTGIGELGRSAVPKPDTSPAVRARSAVAVMSMEQRVGQLVMAPLSAGTDPSSLEGTIRDRHVGSVLVIGNWNDGVASVRQATDALQSYAPANNRLLMTTDQEGGQVQHLQGNGFSAMPSAVEQGRMDTDQLRRSAAVWGSQLAQAGINVDLAPVVGTVTVARASNAPIGALDRDFGLDAAGNAAHAGAFVLGMRDAGVATSIKHYPSLGSVTGNTDFTASSILDTTTTLDGPEINAFNATFDANPSMVMMSLATYQRIDPDNPAVFSHSLITDYLRGTIGFQGVVTSDSMSAAALSGIQPSDLGVRLIEAGGDLACIGASSYVQPVLDGLKAKASADPSFAQQVTRSVERVMTLKYSIGLAR